MDMTVWTEIIGTFGLNVAVIVYFAWQMNKKDDIMQRSLDRQSDLMGDFSKALQENTLVLSELRVTLEHNEKNKGV